MIKKICFLIGISFISLNADLIKDINEGKEGFHSCAMKNFSYENFFTFAKLKGKSLTPAVVTNFNKDYIHSLLNKNLCSKEFNLYLSSAIQFDKELRKNPQFSTPANYDFFKENYSKVIDLEASRITYSELVNAKK